MHTTTDESALEKLRCLPAGGVNNVYLFQYEVFIAIMDWITILDVTLHDD